MSEPTKAVFLSYASQDAEAARRICEALRAAGIEVWFDQSELRGGDAWDQHIRRQIHDCALFVPLISANTDARSEGYFRLEWKLAVDRSHLMADDAAFLLPVVIDDTPDAAARVPDKFRTVQWTRLAGGTAPPAFCQRVGALLAGNAKPVRAFAGEFVPPRRSRRRLAIAAMIVMLVSLIALLSWWAMRRAPGDVAASQKIAAAAASAVPAHSIAVLPFADMSSAKDQEYFSDGLAEELLNLLSKVPGLQVAARTSAFSFKGHAADIPTIGRQLMVANVLEGSVRKVGNHLRVTAQLVRADNGYEVWSEIYDSELGDVFRLQDEIAIAVVKALKVRLLGQSAPSSVSTQNPDAYLVFLQGRARMASQRIVDVKAAAADFARVLKLDPGYGPAYVELAAAKMQLAEFEVTSNRQAAFAAAIEEGKLLIEQALALDPSNAQAYVERGHLRAFSDLNGSEQDYRRGIELNPNSARGYDGLATVLFEDPRRRDEALAMLDRARHLDPLEPKYDVLKAVLLYYGRSDISGAKALLLDVVAHHPLYAPTYAYLAGVSGVNGHYAQAVMYGEQALKLDSLSEWPRRALIMDYVNSGDVKAAEQVADAAPQRLPIQRLVLLINAGDWHRAAETTYTALADNTYMPIDEPWAAFALRMEARSTRDFGRARIALERLCGVTWGANGIPVLPTQLGMASASVGLGDILIASGERARGERLLRASLADMEYVGHDLKRGDLWYLNDRPIALALLGNHKAAYLALHRTIEQGLVSSWWLLGIDPAFEAIASDAEFLALKVRIREKIASERQILDRLRAEGRVPDRGTTPAPGAAAPRTAAATP